MKIHDVCPLCHDEFNTGERCNNLYCPMPKKENTPITAIEFLIAGLKGIVYAFAFWGSDGRVTN